MDHRPAMRALIVEDEPIFRMDLTMRLKRLGFDSIDETPYAGKSIEIAREHAFDLIIMDIRLKDDLSGIDAAREISREWTYPIIVMSAYQINEDEIRRDIPTLRRFVSKPVSDDDLRSAVSEAVG